MVVVVLRINVQHPEEGGGGEWKRVNYRGTLSFPLPFPDRDNTPRISVTIESPVAKYSQLRMRILLRN